MDHQRPSSPPTKKTHTIHGKMVTWSTMRYLLSNKTSMAFRMDQRYDGMLEGSTKCEVFIFHPKSFRSLKWRNPEPYKAIFHQKLNGTLPTDP